MNRRRILVVAAVGLCAALWTYACGDGATEPPPPDPPRPTTVTVTPATVQLTALGATEQLTAEVRDQNGNAMAGAAVSWASSADSVAAVSASGLVTALGNGMATIAVTAGSASGSATVTVAQEVSAVAVTPAADTVVTGDTLRLVAEAADANGHPVAGTEFEWASSDTLVALVDDAGLVTGVRVGEAEVTATAAAVTGRAALMVVAPAPTAVAVTPDTVTLTALGQTVQLAAEVRDQIGRVMEAVRVSWASAETTIAAVDSAGLVTAIGGGATTVAATVGEASGEAVVTVMQSVGSVVVSPALDTVALGDTLRLTAEAFDENSHVVEGAEFAWSSSDVSVATVDGAGLVRGIAEGMATVTAAAGDVGSTAEITVANPDRAALAALYEATDGPNWVNSENWLTDAPLGDWYGVDTDASGRVVRLDLSGTWEGWIPHGLSGSIPSVLGNLSNLTWLDLSLNELTGPIPPELGGLAHLEWLDLSNNGLTGPVPPELGNLADLELLGLADNKLTGRIPSELGSLTSLKQLFLAWNELTGPIPPELGSLADLEWLHLTSNELTGRIPSELAGLAKLGQLDVDRNRLTGSVPRNFLDLTELTYFFFHENTEGLCAPGISSFADWLGAMEESEGPFCSESDTEVLESLFEVAGGSGWTNDEGWLGGPLLAGWHGVDVDSLGLVTGLDLSRNGLAGRLPGNLGELAQMTELRIAGNAELAGPVPLSLSALSLQTLHYAGTGLCTPVDTSFRDWVSTIPSHEGTDNECPAWTLSGTVSHGWGPAFITNEVGHGASYRPRTGSAGGSGRERRVGGLGKTASTTPGARGVWTDPSVTTPTGRVIGAVVEVVDGPDAGRQATSDEDGRYVLEGLGNAGFTIRVMAEGFASVSGVVDLTSDAGLDSLARLDIAISHELPAAGPPVPFPDTDPEWLQVLAADYPHVYQVANVRVFSDISPTFSREHAEHLKLVYDFFNGLYAKNAGNHYDVYYTTDPEVFLKLNPNPHCHAEIAVEARTVSACYLDYPRWFIIPYTFPDPDFGTQLHEIGHDFHGRTWPLSYFGDVPSGWFIEGTAMYWEGGVFTDEGSLTVPVPHPYCTSQFQRADREGTLIPLGELINLGDAFYPDPRETYALSCMLFHYLEHHEPGVLYAVIDRINSEQIVTNDHLVAALIELTGKSVSELEEVYLSFSRGWP